MNGKPEEKSITPADSAAAAEMLAAQREINQDRKEPVIENQNADMKSEERQLAPLFLPDAELSLVFSTPVVSLEQHLEHGRNACGRRA